jgi:hypothetical protein
LIVPFGPKRRKKISDNVLCEDFKAWLDERGFVYDENRAHLAVKIRKNG